MMEEIRNKRIYIATIIYRAIRVIEEGIGREVR